MIIAYGSHRPGARLALDDRADERSRESDLAESGPDDAPALQGEDGVRPPARPEVLGGLTSAALYDEVRRRLADRGYRWE
jgi:hypothetical protein